MPAPARESRVSRTISYPSADSAANTDPPINPEAPLTKIRAEVIDNSGPNLAEYLYVL